MLDQPYTLLRVTDLVPGTTIIRDGGNRLVVDEVSRLRDEVRVYGYPETRVGEGRRVMVAVPLFGDLNSDLVRVAPTGDELAQLRDALMEMAATAGREYSGGPTDFGVALQALVIGLDVKHENGVRVEGTAWVLPLQPLPEKRIEWGEDSEDNGVPIEALSPLVDE